MAQKDARIRFLERELAEREKEMETMKEPEQPAAPAVDDERLRELERKVRELEALVKGLTEEVLDLKSVTMKLSREAEERRVKQVATEGRKAGATLQAEPRAAVEPRVAAVPREPAQPAEKQPVRASQDDADMELIMQNDGTLKPEPRRSSEYIVASNKFGNAPMKGQSRSRGGKSSDRTLFVEQKKREVENVIQAEEDDTVDLDR